MSIAVEKALSKLPYSAFGEMLVAQLKPEAAWRFDYGVNTRMVRAVTANGGTVTMDGNRALLQTSAANNGSARIETLRRLRYLPGLGGLVRITGVFDTPKASSQQFIGIGDTSDRLFFGYNGLEFGCGLRRGGTDTFIAQSAWNGKPLTFNPAYGNIFQIRFQWLGYGYLRFYLLDPHDQAGGYHLAHVIRWPNTSPNVHLLNPTLPLFAEVINAGNASNLSLYTPSALAAVEGQPEAGAHPLNVPNSFDASATFSNTSNNHLLTIRNKSTFGAITNRVPVQINSITFARGSAGAASSTVRIYRNATTAGTRTYVDVDATNSPVDTSVTTTTISSANPERRYTVTSTVTLVTLQFKPGELVLDPGDAISLGVLNASNAGTDHVTTVNWEELF